MEIECNFEFYDVPHLYCGRHHCVVCPARVKVIASVLELETTTTQQMLPIQLIKAKQLNEGHSKVV